jgi:phosphoribosylamine--glycine ligase
VAGAALKDGCLVTSGGRVLGVCASAETLEAALALAYERTEKITFEGAFYRHDIGRRALLAFKE